MPGPQIDVIEDSKRAVEDEIVQYRVLSYSFAQNGQNYLLEIGRSTDSIGETERNFRRYAFYILLVAVVLTTLADLAYFRYLLAPFYTIIRHRLKNSQYPPAFDLDPVPSITDDFRYLDESLREMMATIQASFTKERKFIADASHELLTPLGPCSTALITCWPTRACRKKTSCGWWIRSAPCTACAPSSSRCS